jgi:ADP-ribose pyrophosphatase YjhB (NUDIX family)
MSLAGPVVWLLPGRGVKPGETYEQAAAREALGEAGISGISLGPCVWTAEYTATWPDDAPMHVVLRYYLARVEAGRPVSFAGHEPAEAATTVGCRWFTLTEVIERESAETFRPAGLGGLFRDLLRVPTDGRVAEPLALTLD